ERTTEVGAAGYLVKPFTAPAVRAAISTAMGGHQRLQRARGEARSLSSILGSLGDALFVLDEQDKISFANPRASELTGWPLHETEGRGLLEVVTIPVDGEKRTVQGMLVEARRTRVKRTHSSLSIRQRGGAELTVDLGVEPVQEEGQA